MRVIIVDAWQKKTGIVDVSRDYINDERIAPYLKPSKEVLGHEVETPSELKHHILGRSGGQAIKLLTAMSPIYPSPMWLYKGVQAPLFGIGAILGYDSFNGVYFGSPINLDEVMANVEWC